MRAYQAYRDLDDRDLAERLLYEANEAFERLKLLAHANQVLAPSLDDGGDPFAHHVP